MIFDKPIKIQTMDEATETWKDLFTLHARVNKYLSGKSYLTAGAIQSNTRLIFEVRYFKRLEEIENNKGAYRIIYKGISFNVEDFDDFEERHETVKLLGVSY